MSEKGSKTVLHRGFTKSIKKILKTVNWSSQKWGHLEGDGYSLKRGKWLAGTLVKIHWRWL